MTPPTESPIRWHEHAEVPRKKAREAQLDQEIGPRIKALRKQLGATQIEFSRLVGVLQCTVSGWETGRYQPSRMALLLIGHISADNWWFKKANDARTEAHS